MSHATNEYVLASAIAASGTVTVPYPTGTAQGNFKASGHFLAVNGAVLSSDDSDFSASFGASVITLTNGSGQPTWPAGATLRGQFDLTAVEQGDEFESLYVTGDMQVDGTLLADGGVTGDLTGDVTGDVTGDITGDVTGSVSTEAGDTVALAASSSLAAASGSSVVVDPGATFTGDPVLAATHDGRRWEYFEDFNMQTLTEADHPFILVNGGGTTAADAAVNTQEGGAVRLTGGEDDSEANDRSVIVHSVPIQADSGGLVLEARVALSAITTTYCFVGVTDVNSGAEQPFTIGGSDAITDNADDAIGFVFDTDADTDEWFCLGVDEGTGSTGRATSGVAPVAATYNTLRIEIDATGEDARFYIDGTLVGTITANAIDVDVDLFFTIYLTSRAGASRTADVDYIYLSRDR